MTTDTFLACRAQLETLYQRSPQIFRELFHEGRTLRSAADFDEGSLVELKIIERDGEFLNANMAITYFEDTFIATDFIRSPNLDRVFPVYPDESYLLALWPTISATDVILDLCTGSGVVAILASKRGAAHVYASDITQRSKTFFDLNVRINSCHNIEFIHSDVLESISKLSYSIITCNPPFVPIPENVPYFIHSAGGRLGTALIERVLSSFEAFEDGTRLYMTCLSLGSPSGWRVEELCRTLAMNSDESLLNSTYFLPIYGQSWISLQTFFSSLPSTHRDANWTDAIRSTMGYTKLGYFGLSIDHAKSQEVRGRLNDAIEQLVTVPPFGPLQRYCWSMENRMCRYTAHA